MIRFDDVWMSYDEEQVLRGVSFQASKGQITALVGPSGSGKSTVLRLIIGFVKPAKGQVLVENEDVGNLSEHRWREVRKKMGMVFQSSALFDSMNVLQNVGFYPHYVEGLSWRSVQPQAMELLEELGLAAAAEKLPSELSGGMQRRVALARSLIYRPKILLYDEPTTGLDPQMTRIVTDLIQEMNERYGVTSVVVSHDLPSINEIADHVVLIDQGQSVPVGPPVELLRSNDRRVCNFASTWREQILHHSRELAEQARPGGCPAEEG